MIILQDSKEQQPWDFTFFGLTQVRKGLLTGDYVIEGSNHFVFERKKSVGEISVNLGSKWKQFENEMQRMQAGFVCPFIICEFPLLYLDTFPVNSGIPKSKWRFLRMSSVFIKKRLFENCEKYGIQLVFADSPAKAQTEVFNIINEKFKITG